MGNESEVQFVGVQLRRAVLEDFINQVQITREKDEQTVAWMLEGIRIDTDIGYLDWNLGKRGKRELLENGFEPPLKLTAKNLRMVAKAFIEFWWDGTWIPVDKWYYLQDLVHWLYPFCESGMILQISIEGDGLIWGGSWTRRGGSDTSD